MLSFFFVSWWLIDASFAWVNLCSTLLIPLCTEFTHASSIG
jgi:hypothetical protein